MTDTPTQTQVSVNGVDLALFEWSGAGPALLFVHAAGFHARCWDQVIKHLPDRHCYTVDLRGHGRSAKPPPPYSWRTFGEDMAALARTLGLAGAIGVGHSTGGHALTLAAAHDPRLFSALLLIEPVIMSKAVYRMQLPEEHFAARRRNHWASPDEMFDRFKGRPPFNRWDPAVLRDYCDYGLLPAADGDRFVLACPPSIEASIYHKSLEADIYDEIATVTIPVRVLRAGRQQQPGTFDMEGSPTAPDLAAHFRRGEDIHLPEYSHFVPMEAPELIAGYVRQIGI
jgi:lipase